MNPVGRDRLGNCYWYQVDQMANLRYGFNLSAKDDTAMHIECVDIETGIFVVI